MNKPAPLPLKIEPLFIVTPPLIKSEPVNCEPLPNDSTLNPNSFETDAVTEPLLINGDKSASGVNAALGILNKPAPLPLNIDAVTLPATYMDELNSALFVPSNRNPYCGETDAVTEPDVINADKRASGVKAALGISNKFLPLPLNDEPLLISMFPLTKSEELNSALVVPSNLNP